MGENFVGFSLVLEVSGALNLYVVVWDWFYRLQESLHRGDVVGGGTLFV